MPLKPFDVMPIWGIFIVTVTFILAFVEVGFRLGEAKRRRTEDVKEAAVGSMVGAILGLLAFMLAFTFGMAAARHDARRALVLDEANMLRTTYLRAGFLPSPQRTEARSLLRKYVETRLSWDGPQELEKAITKSEEIQRQLWSQALATGEKNPSSVVVGLYIESLNDAIILHTKRVKAGGSRIPVIILGILFFLASLAMTSMGYLAGIAGKRTNLVTVALVLAFSSVMLLIIDLDRPREGLLKVSQKPLQELLRKMSESP